MTAPIGFTATSSTVVRQANSGSPAPAAFGDWPPSILDELKNRLLTSAVKDVQYWATQSHPKLSRPARAQWADLFGQAYQEMLQGHRTVTQPAADILLQYYPNNDPRPTPTTLAYIQNILERKLSGPEPDVDEIRKWFGLLFDQQKMDVIRQKAGYKPAPAQDQPHPLCSPVEAERRRQFWDILGWTDAEKDRVEAQIMVDLAADRAEEAAQPSPPASIGVPPVPAGASPAEPSSEPSPDHPDPLSASLSLGRAPAPAPSGGEGGRRPGEVAPSTPTDLLGQPLDQTPTRPSTPANPAHPFSAFMSAPPRSLRPHPCHRFPKPG